MVPRIEAGPLAATESAGAFAALGAAAALFHGAAAAVMGNVIRGALAVVSSAGLAAAASRVPPAAGGEHVAGQTNEDAHGATLSSDGHVAEVMERALQAVVADAAKCDSAQPADGPSSHLLQAVSYPLTPRRLVALRDRNQRTPAADAKLHGHDGASECR